MFINKFDFKNLPKQKQIEEKPEISEFQQILLPQNDELRTDKQYRDKTTGRLHEDKEGLLEEKLK